jgi:hypothetical protein
MTRDVRFPVKRNLAHDTAGKLGNFNSSRWLQLIREYATAGVLIGKSVP